MTAEIEDSQYNAWGVIVQTSRVKAGHIANGLVQLLRIIDTVPAFPTSGSGRVQRYVTSVVGSLRDRFAKSWELSDAARDACLARDGDVARKLSLGPELRALVAGVLNADGLVMSAGGNDPTTPGLSFAGYTSVQTLKGMHAATYLGLLCRTEEGAEALRALYAMLLDGTDPHSALLRDLGLAFAAPSATPATLTNLLNRFPLPDSQDWSDLAALAGKMTRNLLAWSKFGAPKVSTFMAIADLAALLSFLRLTRWRGRDGGAAPLLLMFSPLADTVAHFPIIARAQQNLRSALAALDQSARRDGLVIEKKNNKGTLNTYFPSLHARNLGAASGWLYPIHAQGGANRYFRPQPRQMTTLVQALVHPGDDISWLEFASRAQELGLVVGGPREASVAKQLGLQGGSLSLRNAGLANRQHLVALGLARQESDNVVRVDGGLR